VVRADQFDPLRLEYARGSVVPWPFFATKSGGYGRVRTVGAHLAVRDHGGAADVHPASRLLPASVLSAATAGAKTLRRQAPDRPDAASRIVTGNSSVEFSVRLEHGGCAMAKLLGLTTMLAAAASLVWSGARAFRIKTRFVGRYGACGRVGRRGVVRRCADDRWDGQAVCPQRSGSGPRGRGNPRTNRARQGPC